MTAFLEDLQSRPVTLAESKGLRPTGLFLGQGSNALEVVATEASGAPTLSSLRSVWKARLAGRASPLLLVCLYGGKAALCGPIGDPPPTFLDLDAGQVERICRAGLQEPDRHAAQHWQVTWRAQQAGNEGYDEQHHFR